jgi:hypothetical protein
MSKNFSLDHSIVNNLLTLDDSLKSLYNNNDNTLPNRSELINSIKHFFSSNSKVFNNPLNAILYIKNEIKVNYIVRYFGEPGDRFQIGNNWWFSIDKCKQRFRNMLKYFLGKENDKSYNVSVEEWNAYFLNDNNAGFRSNYKDLKNVVYLQNTNNLLSESSVGGFKRKTRLRKTKCKERRKKNQKRIKTRQKRNK